MDIWKTLTLEKFLFVPKGVYSSFLYSENFSLDRQFPLSLSENYFRKWEGDTIENCAKLVGKKKKKKKNRNSIKR